jgi:hypothetical protein
MRRLLLVALVLVTIAIGGSPADARNDSGTRASAYWFYQGYLSGSVHKYVVCCNTINKGRISYECSGYSENASYIRINGSWENYSTQFYCDTTWNVNVTYYSQWGCQNPAPQPYLYTNCHLDNTA